MKLKYIGPGSYRGRGVTVKSGAVVDCKADDASQLLSDFPTWFEKVESEAKPATAKPGKSGKAGKPSKE